MADRLEELRRQRALVQQHAEWLDREIAAESAKMGQNPRVAEPDVVVTRSSPTKFPAASPEPGIAPQANPDAEKILDEYRVAPSSLHSDVRKGCFLYFAAALAIFFGVVAILYFTLSRR